MRKTAGLLILGIAFVWGCETAETQMQYKKENHTYGKYLPIKAEVATLSEMTYDDKNAKLKIFLNLRDSFGSQIKAPAVVRFELYQKVPKAMEQKGKRISIWPDADLTEPQTNNQYWRDFLRSYEFELTTEPLEKKDYVIEATVTLPDGKKLFTEYVLKP